MKIMNTKLRTEKMIEIIELFSTVETHNLCKELLCKYIRDYTINSIQDDSLLYENDTIRISYNTFFTESIYYRMKKSYWASDILIFHSKYFHATKDQIYLMIKCINNEL